MQKDNNKKYEKTRPNMQKDNEPHHERSQLISRQADSVTRQIAWFLVKCFETSHSLLESETYFRKYVLL